MRKVIAVTFVSLDGVMQAPGGPQEDTSGGFKFGGWTLHHWDEAMGHVMDSVFGQPFDLLLGRKTYDIFAAHWPRVEGDALADKFNAVTKYVATRSSQPLNWQNSVALRGDVASVIARMKQEDGPALLLQGSSELLQTLLAKDLLDEFTLLVFPVILGSGKKFFGEGAAPAGLQLTQSKVSSTGVTMNTYRRSGGVTTGSFALEDSDQA